MKNASRAALLLTLLAGEGCTFATASHVMVPMVRGYMPAGRDILSHEDIEALVSYIRLLSQ